MPPAPEFMKSRVLGVVFEYAGCGVKQPQPSERLYKACGTERKLLAVAFGGIVSTHVA